MKTSEMIAMLEENPNLKFININNNGVEIIDGILVYPYYNNHHELQKDDLFLITQNILKLADWQLVREPVPWQEAIQAYIDGKEVECECKECSMHVHKKEYKCNVTMTGICKYGLKHGKWFIKGAD